MKRENRNKVRRIMEKLFNTFIHLTEFLVIVNVFSIKPYKKII